MQLFCAHMKRMNRALAIHVVALLLFVLLTPVAASIVTSLVGVNVVEAFECWCRKDDGGWSAGGLPAPGAGAAAVAAPLAVVPSLQGRYVRLGMPVVGYLNIAEVQVYSAIGGANVAQGKPVTMSSTYSGFPPSNLTDGVLTNFTSTNGTEAGWMLVDLGAVVPIAQIVVSNRADCCQERANGMTVSVLDAAQTLLFTSNPCANKAGSTTYVDTNASNTLATGQGFNTYTVTPPSPVVVGA